MNDYKQLPYYAQLCIKLLLLFLIGTIIYLGHNIITPLYFSVLLSILLLPVTNFLERLKVPRMAGNLIAVIMALFIIAAIIYFLSTQISSFVTDIPSLKKHLSDNYITLKDWINEKFHISFKQQSVFVQNATNKVKSSGGDYIGQTFSSLTNMVITIILVAIYSVLILYYRHMIKRFLFAVFNKDHSDKIQEVLSESKNIVKNYMLGLLIEMGIVACINVLLLLCIGIKYAVFLGILAAILNIIPYIGIFTAIGFTVLVTLTTSSHLGDIVWVIVSLEIVHIIDANFIMPRIVGSKVKINALVTIVGVVVGGTLMGISGIFLALPTIAILKIIFDRVDDLKPWGMLLGDDSITKQRKVLRIGKKKQVPK